MPEKKLIFSLSKQDFEIQTFRSGGSGGQHQNTTDSGVRIIHRESGARGESRNHRSQYQNKKAAFERLVASPLFKLWVQRKVHEINQGRTIEQEVEKLMQRTQDFKIEVKGNQGRWTEVEAI